MLKQKRIRTRGKIGLKNYFKELKEGDRVAIVRELSIPSYFSHRMQGLSGVVAGKKGRSYIVKLRHGNKEKEFIIQAAHLKKLK